MQAFLERLEDATSPLVGFWIMSASSLVAEAVAGAGFDWLLLDMEHSPNELPAVIDQLRAVSLAGCLPIVRPPSDDPVMIKRLLDAGAQALLVPYVQSPEQAARAVAATRYPPDGIRGYTGISRANHFGRQADYARTAKSRTCLIVQIETAAAVENVAAIAAVDGVDALFVGPADLAVDLGHHGAYAEPTAWAAVLAATAAAAATGKPCGILVANLDQARQVAKAGATFIGVGGDLSLIARQSDALVAAARSAF